MDKCARCACYVKMTLSLLGRKYCQKCYVNEIGIFKQVPYRTGVKLTQEMAR